ncbi:hypothetical protein RUM44_008832 [Polyplax serrata]|uniref:Uncharacterized protein n=1 Tax=Polyplax serrata TaxID=468196 RepID=A0ABR1B9C9_POLSC
MNPECEPSESQSQRLPDTCPISQTDLSQQLVWNSQNVQKPWGRLYPTVSDVPSLEMIKDEYIIGRGPNCDLSLGSESGERLHGAISKNHFKIRRTNISKMNCDDYIVYLDDLSSNGTFINGRKVGKGKSAILENNNEISVCIAKYKVFIYISSNLESEVRGYPEEVKSKYSISRIIGSGSFGQVRLVFRKSTGQPLAMKVIQKKRFCNDTRLHLYDPVRMQREVDVLKALSNEFIIKFEDVIDCRNYMFILTEYMEGGELFDRVKNGPLGEYDAKLYFLQLAIAVKYLHDNDIIHRDIKLENILLSSKSNECLIKLSDFGFSKFLDSNSVVMTYCGTPLYIAPEILKNKGRGGSYDKQVDVWSMGVVLYICLSGVPPFPSSDTQLLTEQILNGRYSFSSRHWGSVTRKALNLVRRMLTVNHVHRISTEDILKHDWLKDKSVNMRLNRLTKSAKGLVNSGQSDSEIDSDLENERNNKKARFETQ